MNKNFKKKSNKEEKSVSTTKKVIKKDSEDTENKRSSLLSNKRMTFDFDNNIIDKLNNNRDSRTYISQTSSNAANSWNYAKVLSKEREFRSITNGNKYDNKSNKKELQNTEEDGVSMNEDDNEDDNENEDINVEEKQAMEDKFDNDLFEKNCSFTDFGLSKLLLRACSDLNFFHPTKVQAKVIPLILDRNDVLVNAETGSGKTACFLLPILQRIFLQKKSKTNIKALIIIPTRELALQCSQMLDSLVKYLDSITHVTVVGGMDIKDQISKLNSQPDIIIATPGRLIDMIYNYKSIELDFINVLILDEADKLLELGFKDAILEILHKMGKLSKSEILKTEDDHKSKGKKTKQEALREEKYSAVKGKNLQTLLFSATLNTKVIDLGNTVLYNPVKLKLAHSNVLNNLKQSIVRMKFKEIESNNPRLNNSLKEEEVNGEEQEENDEKEEKGKNVKQKNKNNHSIKIKNKKESKSNYKSCTISDLEFMQRMAYLIALVKDSKRKRSIIFFNTKLDCHKANIILQEFGINAAEIHSDVYQTERIQALENFQKGSINYLLATDVVGRGIDVEKVKCVINFQMPLQADRYTHRIGRTARKGNMGQAITICNENDRKVFKQLLKQEKFPLHPLRIENNEIKVYFKDLKQKKKLFNELLESGNTDKELEKAEVEVEKSIRRIEFNDEIQNRPKK